MTMTGKYDVFDWITNYLIVSGAEIIVNYPLVYVET